MKEKYIPICVNITNLQRDFIKEEKKKSKFNVSNFLRYKLNEYIKFREEAVEFKEQW